MKPKLYQCVCVCGVGVNVCGNNNNNEIQNDCVALAAYPKGWARAGAQGKRARHISLSLFLSLSLL